MIIISHNRVINWSTVIMARAYNGLNKRRIGHTELILAENSATYLTIKFDDFKEQLKNAGKANIRVLELDY